MRHATLWWQRKHVTWNCDTKMVELHINVMFSIVVIIYFFMCFNSHQETEHAGVSVCVSTGCEHARQTWGESLHLWSLFSLIEKPHRFLFIVWSWQTIRWNQSGPDTNGSSSKASATVSRNVSVNLSDDVTFYVARVVPSPKSWMYKFHFFFVIKCGGTGPCHTSCRPVPYYSVIPG